MDLLPARRRTEPSRLEAFSDGVFAISATLLVVNLEVPRSFEALKADLTGFVAFGLSFMALVMIWSVHNAFFRRYGLQDGWTVALNGALLFVVLFYVFPLKFLAQGFVANVIGIRSGDTGVLIRSFDELASVFALYGGGFVLVFTFVSLLYRHASRRAALLALTDYELEEARFLARHYALYVVVGLLSVLLALFGFGIRQSLPGFIYAALGPLCWWHARATHPSYRKVDPAAGSSPQP